MTTQKDRYKLNLFYAGPGSETNYLNVQDITDDVYSATDLCIVALAMDFPNGTSAKVRKELENKWQKLLPTLAVMATKDRQTPKTEFFVS